MTRRDLTRLRNHARYYTPHLLLAMLGGAVAAAVYAVGLIIVRHV